MNRLDRCAAHLGATGFPTANDAGQGALEPRAQILEAIKEFDTPTIFNAVSRVMRDLTPQKWYTDHTVRHLLPELGSFCGYAVTAEVSTNDDADHIGMNELWKVLKDTEGPVVTLLKDIDSNPGRGASTGDGMSRNQKFYGVVGCIVDGTVRDVPGIKKVGLPVMGWGTVPGHGPFLLHSVNKPLVICDMEVSAGDIIFADLDGCCKVPVSHAEEIVACAGEIRRWESEVFEYFRSPDYDPEEAGPILAEIQTKFPLLEKYPTDNGSKDPTPP